MFKPLWSAIAGLVIASAAAGAWAATDVNQATQAELESIRGVGPGTAGRILEERKKSPFKDWADLVGRVKGVGDGNAAKLSTAGLTVNGAPYAAPDKTDKKETARKGPKKDTAPGAANAKDGAAAGTK
jgi:competence protein ComEA